VIAFSKAAVSVGSTKVVVNPELRQQIFQQGMGAAINGIAGNNVVAAFAKLKQGAGDGGHAAGGAYGKFGALPWRTGSGPGCPPWD
jgi:hypothetical protein